METSEIELIDTHCHLYAEEFAADRDYVIRNANLAGVKKIFMPNIDMHSRGSMLALAHEYPGVCMPMLGLHPCSVKPGYEEELALMYNDLSGGKYYGVGETGVDLYWDTSNKDIQVVAFEQQIEWALAFDLPVIIHSRESLDLNIDIISNFSSKGLRGIFHCFGGDLSQARRIHETGLKIGIGGVITFKKSNLGELLPLLPRDMILLETDAPYLAPVPYRGKRNEPAYIKIIAAEVARCLGIAIEEVALLTSSNAEEVFRKKV